MHGMGGCSAWHGWRAGDAVLFHSMKPNGELEERSLHAACPVIRGTKWSMPKW